MALTKAHNRMIEGAQVNVKDYGAVGDGVTDDTAAIQAAMSYLTSNTGGILYFPKGQYVSSSIELKSGVSLVGEGSAHHAFYVNPAYNKSGTVLLINAGVGQSCVFFEDSPRGMNSIEKMSIYNTGTTAFDSIVKVNGALHVSMQDVELGSLTKTLDQGIGLRLNRSASNNACIYGNYSRIVTLDGLLTGLSLEDDANSNCFSGCSFGAAKYSMEAKAVATPSGPLGVSFNGCSFESNYDSTVQDIRYISGADNIHGFNAVDNVYIVSTILITHCDGLSFDGCYFENGGVSGTFNDGSNGTWQIAPVISVNPSSAENAINVRWNGRMAGYVFDKGNNIEFSQLPDHTTYNTSLPISFIRRNSTATVVPSAALTALTYVNIPSWHANNGTQFGYNNSTGALTFRQKGTYKIYAQIRFPNTAASFIYLRANINSGAKQYYGPSGVASGNTTLSIDVIYHADVNDTLVIEMFQNSGGNVTVDASVDFSHMHVIKV